MAKFAEIYPDREFVQQLLANYQTLDLPCRTSFSMESGFLYPEAVFLMSAKRTEVEFEMCWYFCRWSAECGWRNRNNKSLPLYWHDYWSCKSSSDGEVHQRTSLGFEERHQRFQKRLVYLCWWNKGIVQGMGVIDNMDNTKKPRNTELLAVTLTMNRISVSDQHRHIKMDVALA